MPKLKIYTYDMTSGYSSTAYYHGFIGRATALADTNASYMQASLTCTFHCNRFFDGKFSALSAFYVPNTLSVHMPLGHFYEPVTYPMPLTLYGISYLGILLFHKQRHYLCPKAFRPRPVIDSYIRSFVSISFASIFDTF